MQPTKHKYSNLHSFPQILAAMSWQAGSSMANKQHARSLLRSYEASDRLFARPVCAESNCETVYLLGFFLSVEKMPLALVSILIKIEVQQTELPSSNSKLGKVVLAENHTHHSCLFSFWRSYHFNTKKLTVAKIINQNSGPTGLANAPARGRQQST